MKCSDCKFWRVQSRITHRDETQIGRCHRSAPLTHVGEQNDGAETMAAYWPLSLENEFCGEFASRAAISAEQFLETSEFWALGSERRRPSAEIIPMPVAAKLPSAHELLKASERATAALVDSLPSIGMDDLEFRAAAYAQLALGGLSAASQLSGDARLAMICSAGRHAFTSRVYAAAMRPS